MSLTRRQSNELNTRCVGGCLLEKIKNLKLECVGCTYITENQRCLQTRVLRRNWCSGMNLNAQVEVATKKDFWKFQSFVAIAPLCISTGPYLPAQWYSALYRHYWKLEALWEEGRGDTRDPFTLYWNATVAGIDQGSCLTAHSNTAQQCRMRSEEERCIW